MSFDAALASEPNWLHITSFNELAEHTYIEPTKELGWSYIDMTARFVDEFKKKARERQSGSSIDELGSLRPVLDSTRFSGTVLVYDLKKDHWSAVGSEGADRRRIPASTYKIFNAMVALETGVVESDRTIIKWDGVTRERTELNRDLDLATAFQLSAVPHFQWLARQIGLARMQHYVDAAGYGNRDLADGVDQFWLTGGLRISPREQVQLLVRLYRLQLPFSQRTMSTVRRIMEVERTPTNVVRAKTGWAVLPEGRNVGWWVGWVERGTDVYFFASVIESPRNASSFGSARTDVPRAILRALGILAPAG
jgi:beta-lactamase class D